MTLTTYYPAPYGTYQQLAATDKFLVCDTADVATNLGNMSDTSPDAVFMGNVGIGTTNPGAKLEIADGAADPVKYGSVQITRSQTNNGNNQLYLSMVRGGSFVGGIGFVPNTNKWGLFNGNTDDPVLTIDGGNVGIGTDAPANLLDVQGVTSVGANTIRFRMLRNDNTDPYNLGFTTSSGQINGRMIFSDDNGSLQSVMEFGSSGSAIRTIFGIGSKNGWASPWEPKFVVSHDGDVGIGTASPFSPLHIKVGVNENLLVRTSGGGVNISAVNDANSVFVPLRMDASGFALMSGNVGIGTSPDPTARLDVNGLIRTNLNSGNKISFTNFYNSGGAGMPYLEMNVDGTTNFGISLWSSSKRYKENIKDLSLKSGKIYDLRPVNFDWKDPLKGSSFGLIAEEVYEILPGLVALDNEGKPHHVTYGLLSVLLLNEVKKLKAEKKTEIESLKQRMDALESKFQGHNI